MKQSVRIAYQATFAERKDWRNQVEGAMRDTTAREEPLNLIRI
jgi:hypothetical protein